MSEENNLTATEYCELLKYNNMLLQLNQKLRENNKSIMEELLRVVGLYNQQKFVLDEIRENLQKSIDSINDKLSDKEIRVENGIIVNPINDYRIVRLKAIRMKCKELLQILDKAGKE